MSQTNRPPSRLGAVAANVATLLLGVAIGAVLVGERAASFTSQRPADDPASSILDLAETPLLPPTSVAPPVSAGSASDETPPSPSSIAEVELAAEDVDADGDPAETDGTASVAIAETREVRATAYCLRGRTRTGVRTRDGVMAADPEVLPLGSVVRIVRGGEPVGIFVVLDTGRAVKGDRVDLWMPDCGAARRWGVRTVTAEVVELGRE